MIIDYKQKFEPVEYRESQQNYFGKRGITWHGALLIYQDPENSYQTAVHYFDQIIDNDSVQDFTSVACCLESALDCIERQFPFIERLTLVSDNAKCYSGAGLLGVVVALSVIKRIKIERLVHTEAGEGKSELDAHFGCAWSWLQRYVNAGNDLLKPSQVVEGLRCHGGMPRSSAHLLKFNVQQGSSIVEEEDDDDPWIEEPSLAPSSNSNGRQTTPLGDFLSKLKPKVKGNISNIRDVEVRFSEDGVPTNLLCRSYSGLSVTEVYSHRGIWNKIRIIEPHSRIFIGY